MILVASVSRSTRFTSDTNAYPRPSSRHNRTENPRDNRSEMDNRPRRLPSRSDQGRPSAGKTGRVIACKCRRK